MSMAEVTEGTRLKVVWLCLEWPSASHSGGVARYSYRLAAEVARLVGLTVITEDGGEPVEGAEMLFLPRARSRLARYYGQPFRLRRVLKQIPDIDVVHAFGDDWAVGRGRWRHVRHFLGMSLSEARSSRGMRKLNHYVLALLEKVSQWRADYRIGIGPESCEAFHCHALMPPVVAIRPTGIPKTSEPSVVFIGSFLGRKRGRLAEAAVQQAERRLGKPIQLTVFGPADDAPRWSDTTVYRAGSTDEDVRAAIESAWALLAPSSYEGFGIPIYEGLALGTAVIATPNPGSTYQSSLLAGPSEALRIIERDEDLADALVDRIRRGAALADEAAKAGKRAAASMREQASAQALQTNAYAGGTTEALTRE